MFPSKSTAIGENEDKLRQCHCVLVANDVNIFQNFSNRKTFSFPNRFSCDNKSSTWLMIFDFSFRISFLLNDRNLSCDPLFLMCCVVEYCVRPWTTSSTLKVELFCYFRLRIALLRDSSSTYSVVCSALNLFIEWETRKLQFQSNQSGWICCLSRWKHLVFVVVIKSSSLLVQFSLYLVELQ